MGESSISEISRRIALRAIKNCLDPIAQIYIGFL